MTNSVKRIEAFREDGQKAIQVDLEKKYGQNILDNKSEIVSKTEEINQIQAAILQLQSSIC